MPLNKYFHGHGSEVMSSMQRQYGAKKGKQVFYATANKKGQKPAKARRKRSIPSRKSVSRYLKSV